MPSPTYSIAGAVATRQLLRRLLCATMLLDLASWQRLHPLGFFNCVDHFTHGIEWGTARTSELDQDKS